MKKTIDFDTEIYIKYMESLQKKGKTLKEDLERYMVETSKKFEKDLKMKGFKL